MLFFITKRFSDISSLVIKYLWQLIVCAALYNRSYVNISSLASRHYNSFYNEETTVAASQTWIGIANNTGVKRAHGNWRDMAQEDSGPKTLLKTLSWLGGRKDAKTLTLFKVTSRMSPYACQPTYPMPPDAFDRWKTWQAWGGGWLLGEDVIDIGVGGAEEEEAHGLIVS